MKLTTQVRFPFDTTVYHKMDPEVGGLVTGILLRPEGILYLVAWGNDIGNEGQHFAMELTDEQSFGMAGLTET